MTAFDVPFALRQQLAWARASHEAIAARVEQDRGSLEVTQETAERQRLCLRWAKARLKKLQRDAGEILRRPA